MIRPTTALVIAVLVIASCTGAPRERAPEKKRLTIVGRASLTGEDPSAVFAVTAPETPRLVGLRISAIENPTGQGLVLRVFFVADREDEPIAVGAVSPFPPDKPDTFTLPVPGKASRALSKHSGPIIRVDLGASVGRVSHEVRVEVELSLG